MLDPDGGARRHLDLISAARQQFERAVKAGLPSGSSAGANLAPGDGRIRGQPSIPGYTIRRELHRGGQGIVYLATQLSTSRDVAIKALREGPFAGESERIRFEREVNILAGFRHNSIIRILDRGEIGGNHFLVMDYIDGRPLDRFARDVGLSLRDRLQLFARVCDAVSEAHLRGVIHRDLKPGNILVTEDGEPRILDFGLAKMANSTDLESAATQTGQILGSLPWISPEQVSGQHAAVDIRSDVYSLGVILYQLLTDQLPYSTVGNLEQVLATIRTAEPIRPSALSREIEDDLDRITLKCLAKEPERRYQSVGELVRDIRYYLAGEAIEAKRDSTWYLAKIMLRRHRAAVAVAAGFVALMTVSSVALTVLYQGKTAEQKRAQAEASKATQIAQFAQGMLSGIDPATAGDMDKRLIRHVLDDSAQRVESELASQPEVQAAVRHTIGKAYQAIGELKASRTHLEKVVEIRRTVLGNENTETLAAMDDLAMLYLDQANLVEAEQLCQAALEGRRRILGPDHPQTLLSMSNLAEIFLAQGKFNESESLARDVLERRKRLLGSSHPETLTSMNNLAGVLRNVRQFDEAERLYRETIEIERQVKGELHPHTLRTMNNLALTHYESGRLNLGEPLFREVLALRQSVFGDEHPDTLNSLGNLADLLRAKGDLDEAEAMFRRLIDVERRVLGNRHPTLGVHIFTLSAIVGQKGDFVQAESLLREAVAINVAALPVGHWQLVTSKIGLGACLSRLSKFEEAEGLLLEGQEAIQGKPEVSDAWRTAAIGYLVRMYDAWETAAPGTGKAAKAAQWREKLTATTAKADP
ncbi:MAG: serine/threonine protein kinase [Planctomycetes bacterium]|nr:serine/threonine protein kinase [Planctomycetota bacterium]